MNNNLSIALRNALRHYFGYEQFRQGQEEIINEINYIHNMYIKV